ncbi:MAG TPA: hypothetical protein VH881_01005 [Burkholderiales bacterium]|jgi:hypothetical protein
MEISPMKFASRSFRDTLEFAAETDVVTPGFFSQLMSRIKVVVAAEPDERTKVLIEVIAPRAELTVFERFQAWTRAFPVIRRKRVAYLVTGRPVTSDATLFELVAHNRGVELRIFNSRQDAMRWLESASQENTPLARAHAVEEAGLSLQLASPDPVT